VFEVLRVRVHELLARAEHPERWEHHDIEDLQRNFTEFFAAVESSGYRDSVDSV
jgi:hypothetical protein